MNLSDSGFSQTSSNTSEITLDQKITMHESDGIELILTTKSAEERNLTIRKKKSESSLIKSHTKEEVSNFKN